MHIILAQFVSWLYINQRRVLKRWYFWWLDDYV